MFSNGSFKNYLGSLTVENGLNPSEKSFSNSYSMDSPSRRTIPGLPCKKRASPNNQS
ncbi:Hypothetical protein FKW44_021030 [Caligus rogercresseyi]|uniref:Uncharacterized protein n=1 Tax=Caligus rogercresseyi TaxID=217165 RepID=A0A7T8JVG8_CALRO|nr:Hypothetical protein FKW44_021030 [Caligus rogercresseyi]